MRTTCTTIVIALTASLCGCADSASTDGTSVLSSSDKRTIIKNIGREEKMFTLGVPPLSVNLKHGETKVIPIIVRRHKEFEDDVSIKFENTPAGVTINPVSPTVTFDNSVSNVAIYVSNAAALGDFTITVVGRARQGADTVSEFTIAVER